MPINKNSNNLADVLSKLECQRALEKTPFAAHQTASSHRHEDACVEAGDTISWTRCDTEKAFEGVPYDEFLGLRFYHVDPLSYLLRYMEAQSKNTKKPRLFLDHEFATHPSATVAVNTCTRRGTLNNLLPGILASSNCRDFIGAKKRAQRIPHYCKMASSCTWKRRGATSKLFTALEADNIKQGAIGNCGFCSAFASLVQGCPEQIRQAFGEHSEEALVKCGAYSVQLFPQGEKRYLLLDDHLLRHKSKGSAPSMHSRQGDTWIEYLEKAIVKVQGSYASLDGHYKHNSLYRHPARALQLLTGAPLALEVHWNVKSPANSFQDVYEALSASQGKYACVAHCRVTYQNLVSNHGYSLLWTGSTAAGEQLVCLRNPHGRCSYRGKYGYRWNWKQRDGHVIEELKKLDFFKKISLGCPITGADNGIFLMEFRVFAQCFPIVTIVGPMDVPAKLNNTQVGGNGIPTPECIYKSKPASLRHMKELLETAKKLN